MKIFRLMSMVLPVGFAMLLTLPSATAQQAPPCGIPAGVLPVSLSDCTGTLGCAAPVDTDSRCQATIDHCWGLPGTPLLVSSGSENLITANVGKCDNCNGVEAEMVCGSGSSLTKTSSFTFSPHVKVEGTIKAIIKLELGVTLGWNWGQDTTVTSTCEFIVPPGRYVMYQASLSEKKGGEASVTSSYYLSGVWSSANTNDPCPIAGNDICTSCGPSLVSTMTATIYSNATCKSLLDISCDEIEGNDPDCP